MLDGRWQAALFAFVMLCLPRVDRGRGHFFPPSNLPLLLPHQQRASADGEKSDCAGSESSQEFLVGPSALRLGIRFNLMCSSRNDGLLLNEPLRLQLISKLESLLNPSNLDQGLYTYKKVQRLGPEQKPLHRPSPKDVLRVIREVSL